MAIKKNAAKADIGPKKQVKATFAECTAEEPLKCKYHGIKQLEGILNSLFQKHGEQNTSGLEKQDGKYLLHFASAQHPKQVVYDLMKILDGKGFGCKYLGTDESGSGINYEIAPKDGKGFVTPDGESELQDADTLSASNAPDKKKDGSEADESKDDVDNLGDAGGNAPSQEDWEKLQKKQAWDDTQLAKWKEMILKGTLEGEPLQDGKKQAVEGTLYLLNAPQAIKDAWKETKNKAQASGEKKNEPTDEDWIDVGKISGWENPSKEQIDKIKNVVVNGMYGDDPLDPSTIAFLDKEVFNKVDSKNPVKRLWEAKKKEVLAHSDEADSDGIEDDSELDADLMDNFDELEEVAEEATEDLEEALLGNSDFDDEIFGDGDKEASQSTTEEDYEKFVGKLIKDPFPPFLKTDAKLLKELVEKGTMNGTAPSKANIEEWEKAYGNGQGPDGAVKDAVNAAFAKLKADGKEKAETPPSLSVQDIKDLVSFKGVKEETFEQNPGLEDTYNAIITTGKNPNGNPLTENQVTWWNDLLDKTKEANPDELPALGVLKRSLEKVGILSGEQKPKTLTDDDIVEAFNPIYNPEDDGPLENNTHYKEFYKSVLTNPSGQELVPAQLVWFKKASEKAHAEGINNYAVELLDKMLEEKGMLTKQPGELSEMDKEKYFQQWNNLMDTAINGKNLMGTQYWEDTISPILDSYNEGLSNNDGNAVSKAISDLQGAVGAAPAATIESLKLEMQSVIDKIYDTGMNLTWDEQKGMGLGKEFEDAVNGGDVKAAQKALDNFKAYIHQLETGGEEDEVAEELSFTDDELLEAAAKKWGKPKSFISKEVLDNLKYSIEMGLWQANGEVLNEKNQAHLKELAEIAGADSALAKKINQTLAKIKSGEIVGTDGKPYVSVEDIKDFFKKCGIKKPSLLSDENLAATKECIATGKWKGKALSDKNIKWYGDVAKKAPDHKVAKAIKAMVDEEKIKKGIDNMTNGMGSGLGMGDDKFKPTSKKVSAKMKSVLLGTSDVDKDYASSGDTASVGMAETSAELLKPLEHDESKFPPKVTKEMLEKALHAADAKALGGASGDNATLVHIGGKAYVLKAGVGSHAEHIHNEVMADHAYRAAGIRAADCKEYSFGGKTYKLAEFIEGTSLYDYMQTATEEQKDAIKKDLLKGFPMDVLFSNWDVIGTSRDNVLVDKEGHAWRIDNGGSFQMAAQHNHKNMNYAVDHYSGKAEFENWENNGGWDKRQWIDDFKTMRLDDKNKGLFDGYSTADIFLSAGNINLGKAVEAIPDENIRKALAKPLFEMKQMATHAVSADISGIKNNAMLSSALDAMYAASKKGFREYASGAISFSNSGIGSKKSDKDAIPPFPEKKPDPPENPEVKFSAGAKLSNAAYTGSEVSQRIIDAAKSINYHSGFVQKDENGQIIGSGKVHDPIDYKPNSNTMAKFMQIEREKLAELAKTDSAAAQLLKSYDSVVTSMNNGYTLPVEHVKSAVVTASLPADFKTEEQKKFEANKAKAMGAYQKELEEYNSVTLPAYNKKKKEWEEKEKAKLNQKSGLNGNLYDIANDFMEAAINTYGIAKHNGENIDFIEKGKDQNKFGGEGENHVKGATTHNMSFCPAASRMKILDLLMRGMTLDEIGNIKDDDPYINNGHWSDNPAKEWFMAEVKALKDNPTLCKRQMDAYAVFKGISVLKWENNDAPVNYKGKTIQCINHASHSVGLVRRESYDEGKINSVAPIMQKAPLASCGFQSAGDINPYPYVYEVPLWDVCYTYSDANHKGSKYESHQGSEHEWVASLMGLTPIKVSSNAEAIPILATLYGNKTIQKEMAQRASRLQPFLTSLEDIKNI